MAQLLRWGKCGSGSGQGKRNFTEIFYRDTV
jgi:hypothetical protein